MAALRKQIGQLERELVAKEARIQGLGGELVTFKEIIGEFEEQKGLVKAKVEQQQEQFRQLEEQFERRLREREEEGVQAMAQQKRMYEEEVRSYEEELEEARRARGADVGVEADADVALLREQVEDGQRSLLEREHQIRRLTSRIVELEEAVRESVAITAERELVLSQQRRRSEAVDKDVRFGLMFGVLEVFK